MSEVQTGQLAKALALAQKEMEAAPKDSTNPHYKSKYADLSSVISAVKGPLSNNGLAYTQYGRSDASGNHFWVTKLMHSSGESIQGELPLILVKKDMQGLGSAITYASRYGLLGITGLSLEDDDGNAAVAWQPPKEALSYTPTPIPALAPPAKPPQVKPASKAIQSKPVPIQPAMDGGWEDQPPYWAR